MTHTVWTVTELGIQHASAGVTTVKGGEGMTGVQEDVGATCCVCPCVCVRACGPGVCERTILGTGRVEAGHA